LIPTNPPSSGYFERPGLNAQNVPVPSINNRLTHHPGEMAVRGYVQGF